MKFTDRFSPRSFIEKDLEENILEDIFNQAIWAPSSYNEQPWRFLYVEKGSSSYDKFLDCIVEANKKWAQNAPVLLLSIVKKTFERDGRENRHAFHDTGFAVSNLINAAVNHGVQANQIGGYDKVKMESTFEINDPYESIAAIALGYTDKEITDVNRSRKSKEEIFFKDHLNFS